MTINYDINTLKGLSLQKRNRGGQKLPGDLSKTAQLKTAGRVLDRGKSQALSVVPPCPLAVARKVAVNAEGDPKNPFGW